MLLDRSGSASITHCWIDRLPVGVAVRNDAAGPDGQSRPVSGRGGLYYPGFRVGKG